MSERLARLDDPWTRTERVRAILARPVWRLYFLVGGAEDAAYDAIKLRTGSESAADRYTTPLFWLTMRCIRLINRIEGNNPERRYLRRWEPLP